MFSNGMTVVTAHVSFSDLSQLLLFAVIAAVVLAVLQWFLCRKDADRGIPLTILSGAFSVLMFVITLFGSHDSEWRWTLESFGNGLLLALLVLLIFSIPTLALFLIYRAAKKKEDREYMNT